ncbi:MAG: sensor histidine kinase, partial [Anaerolineae bacterium]
RFVGAKTLPIIDPTMDECQTHRQTIRTLERLLKISRRLNSTLEMRPLLEQIVDSASDLTNADGASILLMEGDETLRFAAANGPRSSSLPGTEIPLEHSLAGWVVRHREMAVIEDAESDSRMYSIQTLDTTRSIIAAPMIFADKVIGVLESVTTKTRHRFTQQDQETMETLASIAAVAVQNARLFQQSDWISEVMHEIRTPLTALLSYAELLLRPDLDEEARERFVQTIKRETERVCDLATQFLDLARLESGRSTLSRELVDMDEIIRNAIDVLRPGAEERGHRIEIDVQGALPPVIGDKARLHQVLLNLVSNAIKYTEPGGRVAVRAKAGDDEITVAVEDTGPGIPKDQIPQLFRKFQRLPGSEQKAWGTGLGLVVTREIVEAHGGRIWVESEVGRGSVFYVAFPAAQKGDSS